MTGITPVIVPCDPCTFVPSVNDIGCRVTRRTKAVVLVNPGNPSSVVLPKTLVGNIVKLCEKMKLWLIPCESYREFTYENVVNPHHSPPVLNGIIKLYTVSKAYSLAGWREEATVHLKALSM